jgi:glycosyltransferase involved in cell wall biosynthesis
MTEPLLSICLITYNQQDFVEDALRGVKMQQCSHPFELLVADDCSTDHTLERIKDLLQNSGIQQVRILERKQNLGMQKNWLDAIASARGKYVAILEGDDYWTDVHKLQTQIDWLESHPEFAGCFHNTEERHQNSAKSSVLYCDYKEDVEVDFSMLCRKNMMPSCSLVFKLLTEQPFPNWLYQMPMVDWPLSILNSRKGKYKYIPKVMGVHRLHDTSVWSLQSREKNLKLVESAYLQMAEAFKNEPVFGAEMMAACREYRQFMSPAKPDAGRRIIQKIKHGIKRFIS